MNLTDYLAVLRKRAWLIVACTVLGALLAGAAFLALPRSYEANAQLFVSTQGQDSDQLLQGSSFSQQRVKSYAQAMTTPIVLDPVIDELGLPMDSEKLAESLTVTVPLDTVLIDLAVEDGQADRAARIANAISEQFQTVIPTLENTSESRSPLRVTILRTATPPDEAASPKLPILLAAGLLLGLLAGLGLALLRDLTDTVVRGETDVKGLTDKVVIGGIPDSKEAQSQPLAMHTDPHSTRAESFRALRTNLQFIDAARPARSVVVTSSVPGEGKTTTTANLALAIGESGASVCVVEADLRRPRLVSALGLVDGAGLTNLIMGEVEIEDVIQSFGTSNVSVIGSGPIPPNPSELLGSPTMREIVQQLGSEFDYVLFDAPPLLPVTDAAVLSHQVSGVVVVVGIGVVRKEQLRKTLEILETVGAQVLGTVLTRLPGKGADAYSYYRDGYVADPIPDPGAPRTSARRTKRARGA